MNINIQVDMHSTMSLFGIDYRGGHRQCFVGVSVRSSGPLSVKASTMHFNAVTVCRLNATNQCK